MAVVAHLDRRDPHVGQDHALDAHPDIRKIGHREVVRVDGGEVAGVGGGVVPPHLGEARRVEVAAVLAQVDEHELVVAGQGLDEGLLRAVDRLLRPPHRGHDRDPPRLRPVGHRAGAQRRHLKQPVDPLLDEIIVLVVDVGRAEVGVVRRPQFAHHPVVFVADVLPELLERALVGAVGAVVLEAREIPLGGQGGVGVENHPRVDVDAIAGRVEREEFGEVSRLPEEDPHEGVGRAKLADRGEVGDHRVTGDEGRQVGVARLEVLLRHEVQEVLREAVEGLRRGGIEMLVGDVFEVVEHREKPPRHVGKIPPLVRGQELCAGEVEQRIRGSLRSSGIRRCCRSRRCSAHLAATPAAVHRRLKPLITARIRRTDFSSWPCRRFRPW